VPATRIPPETFVAPVSAFEPFKVTVDAPDLVTVPLPLRTASTVPLTRPIDPPPTLNVPVPVIEPSVKLRPEITWLFAPIAKVEVPLIVSVPEPMAFAASACNDPPVTLVSPVRRFADARMAVVEESDFVSVALPWSVVPMLPPVRTMLVFTDVKEPAPMRDPPLMFNELTAWLNAPMSTVEVPLTARDPLESALVAAVMRVPADTEVVPVSVLLPESVTVPA
jgi:hypothetical protein